MAEDSQLLRGKGGEYRLRISFEFYDEDMGNEGVHVLYEFNARP